MELASREARAGPSELIAASPKGERVMITKPGQPAVELVRCVGRGRIEFDRLEAVRRPGIDGDGEPWPANCGDPAFSRQVLGRGDDQAGLPCEFSSIRPICTS